MSTHHTKTLKFVLTTFLVLSLPSGAESQEELPGMEPLEGVPAMLDNEQDLRAATTSFEDGLLALEKAILDEGLRRAIKNDEKSGRSSSQRSVGEASKTLRLCKDSCQTPEERCSDREDRLSNTLGATSCEVTSGECQLQCTQNLLHTISSIIDLTQDQGSGDQAMEQQREQAVAVILKQDLENAKLSLQKGAIDLQRVALEEGIRMTLDEYEEYGVPPGPTRITTADDNLTECSTETLVQTGECIEQAIERTSIFGFATPLLFIAEAQCALIATARQLGTCAGGTLRRFGVID